MKKVQKCNKNIVTNSVCNTLTNFFKCCRMKMKRNKSQKALREGGETVYKVLDVCRHIINYSNEKNYGITNLKLQKILYFVQAYFLTYTSNHKPCFEEEIQAWAFGPVVPVAYNEYRQYGSSNIPTVKTYFLIDNNDFWNSKIVDYEDKILKEDKKPIDNLVDKFSRYSATALVTITHNQTPWKKAYERGKNSVITQEAIRGYFDDRK